MVSPTSSQATVHHVAAPGRHQAFTYSRDSVLAVPTDWKALPLLFTRSAPDHPSTLTWNVLSNKRSSWTPLSKQVLPVGLSRRTDYFLLSAYSLLSVVILLCCAPVYHQFSSQRMKGPDHVYLIPLRQLDSAVHTVGP